MTLTTDNYFSPEADKHFMSVSQYHTFFGTQYSCESKAMAKLHNKWEDKPSTAMLVGSYVDAYFEDSLPKFKAKNPEILTQKGELRSEFKKAEEIIKVAESDELFMTYLSGNKQVIMTAELFGINWKVKIDVLHEKAIVDLKVVKSIREKSWVDGAKLNFIQTFGYIDQGAIYQEVVYKNTGVRLPFFIAALSKEEYTDKEIIHIPDVELEMALSQIRLNIDHVMSLKNHDRPPTRCEKCDYCRTTKKLNNTISFYDI